MTEHIQGLVAATHTPLTPDGELNLDVVPQLVDHLVTDGVRAIFVNGSTGEGVLLTREERQAAAEAFVQAAKGRLTVIVHAGHDAVREAQRLAEHAQAVGADAVAAMPPHYFTPKSVEGLADCLAPIAAAAPRLPFYYYHIPVLTGVALPMAPFLAHAAERMPTLAGIKYTDEDLADFHACLRLEDGRFDMLFGRDEILLTALTLGAKGAVGSTYNYAAPLYLHMRDAFERGDLETARADQHRSIQVLGFLRKYGGLACGKRIMKLVGIDLGPCRLPNQTLSEAETDELASGLRKIGFFDWARERSGS